MTDSDGNDPEESDSDEDLLLGNCSVYKLRHQGAIINMQDI